MKPKSALVLVTVGVCALLVAVLSYALGASQVGTGAGTACLLITGAGLALVNQESREVTQRQRIEGGRQTRGDGRTRTPVNGPRWSGHLSGPGDPSSAR